MTTHFPELKEWASATDSVANAATGFDPETHAPLYRLALGRPGTSQALQIAERLGLDPRVVGEAHRRIAPSGTGSRSCWRRQSPRSASPARSARPRRRSGGTRPGWPPSYGSGGGSDGGDRAGAGVGGGRARAGRRGGRTDLGAAREELAALREEIRLARRSDREARRSAPAARERDRRLGAASERAARAERAIRALDEPLPLTGPLAPGDPVEAPSLGVHGTIAAIEDEAEVVGPAGHRAAGAARAAAAVGAPRRRRARQPVGVVATARGDVSDELDVRGQRAQEAREAVRAFVDDAALAGLPSVRVIHGRGTGAVRTAVRDELNGHPLVERSESDSADGATVAHLAG